MHCSHRPRTTTQATLFRVIPESSLIMLAMKSLAYNLAISALDAQLWNS